MYPQQAPWTGIGALQNEISDLKRQISRKVEAYEIHSINRRLDSLECSMREISTMLDQLRNRCEILERNKEEAGP